MSATSRPWGPGDSGHRRSRSLSSNGNTREQANAAGAGAARFEELIGRNVVGLMSDTYIDPDIAVEVFMVEPIGTDPAVQDAIAVGDRGPR